VYETGQPDAFNILKFLVFRCRVVGATPFSGRCNPHSLSSQVLFSPYFSKIS